jgi:MoaA/NifB/PqqE/SkfB family radical SAM enzyme
MDHTAMKKTFCSKSWTDINIDFETRTVKHCCKAKVYDFPEVLTEEFISMSAGIKERRSQSLANVAHTDCNTCWFDYDKGNSAYRDWANRWTEEQLVNVDASDKYINYIEIKTDRTCDMSCIYCSSWSSSKVAQEQNEPYIDKTNENDYTVFKSWIKNFLSRTDLISDQIVFIFLGGEPTASARFYELVDFIEAAAEGTDKKVRLEICTNANSKSYLMNKLIERMDRSRLSWGIGISNESFGQSAELIRHHLVWDRFSENFIKYIQHPKTELIVMSPTASIFNLKTFHQYIDWVHEQFKIHAPDKEFTWYGNYTSWPDEMDIAYLPKDYVKYVELAEQAINKQSSNSKYMYHDNFRDYLNQMKNRIGTSFREDYKEYAREFLLRKQSFKKNVDLLQLMNNLDL